MKNEMKRVPRLRFSEFSEEWIVSKLGKLGTFKGGGTPSTLNSEYWEGNIPWISSSDIFEDDILNISITRHLSESAVANSPVNIIPSGSLLFVSRVGIGKIAVNKIDLCTSQDFTSLIPKSSNSYFLAYFFLAKRRLLYQFSQGTSIKGFTTGDLKGIPLNLPTLPEQTKIADFLSAIDTRLHALEQKKSLLEAYKKGCMQRLFSQEIRFKDEDGKDFPEWEEKRLGEVADVNPKNSELPNTFYYIDLESVKKGSLIRNSKITKDDAPSRAQRVLTKGDILYQTVRPYQRNNFHFNEEADDYVASTGYAQLRAKSSALFLFQYLHTTQFVKKVLLRCTGTSYPAINSNDLAKIKINLPSLPEQEKIANFLSAQDKKIALLAKQIAHTKAYKKGLLQQMFV